MEKSKELCEKIRTIYPEIGECGMDVDVSWNEEQDAWIVDLKRGGKELTTYLEPQDVDACMAGKQCVALGLQVAQLKKNI
jgi:hypothetical protein